MHAAPAGPLPRIRPLPSRRGVQVVGPAGEPRLALLTPDTVTPTGCPADRFRDPVGAAATVETGGVELPRHADVRVRDGDGAVVAEGVDGEEVSLSPGPHEVALSTGGTDLTVIVDCGVEVVADPDGVTLDLEQVGRVHVGVRSLARGTSDPLDEPVVQPADADSIEHVYVGDGIPLGASKLRVEDCYRRLDHSRSGELSIQVAVICNDPEMAEESVVSELYGDRDWWEFEVNLYSSVGTGRVREILESDVDFLHYVGHVDDEGIRCTDGALDAATLEEVGVDTFLLNACTSYRQGRALVEGGALAGIATITDVLDEGASRIGRTVARLLDQGFTLSAAMGLVREHEPAGNRYVVVGDGTASIVTSESGTPYHVSVRDTGEDVYETVPYGCPASRQKHLGALFFPLVEGNDLRYLNSGRIDGFELTGDKLRSFLRKQNVPVEYGSTLRWAKDPELLAEFE